MVNYERKWDITGTSFFLWLTETKPALFFHFQRFYLVQIGLKRMLEYLGVGLPVNFKKSVISIVFSEKSKKMYPLCAQFPEPSKLAQCSNVHFHPLYQEKFAREWLYTTSMKQLKCKGNYYEE